jgi:hypothetical protein
LATRAYSMSARPTRKRPSRGQGPRSALPLKADTDRSSAVLFSQQSPRNARAIVS